MTYCCNNNFFMSFAFLCSVLLPTNNEYILGFNPTNSYSNANSFILHFANDSFVLHRARHPYEVVHDRTRFSWKKIFAPKFEWPILGQKHGFSNLLKDLVINFYWICFIRKTYIICSVPPQITYLEKILFVRYGPNCSQPQRLRLLNFLISHISRTNL